MSQASLGLRAAPGRLACITLDVESDFTGRTRAAPRRYGLFDTPGHFERFAALLRQHDVPLTAFVVGDVLHDRSDHVRELAKLGVEFGCHSLSHDLGAQESAREVLGGVEAFATFFGYLPQGYRSPCGRLSAGILRMLEQAGVRYDSSIVPSARPGVYWNLRKPLTPFRWRGLALVELPMAAVPRLRLPLALSYLKLLGEPVYTAAQRIIGYPDPLVFLLHPMDLTYDATAFRALPARWKLVYARQRRTSWEVLERFLTGLRATGYRFVPMSALYEQTARSALPEVALP